ncbi:hypothetical protein AGLY_002164 [Aphis glycines]|uniref:Uncharacterized protein n=1 Tax=Aphis glycines TaxID=307491 RepID=A0A6G0U2Q9_APHGL|nr:hypothetical protein AGLY_002164 [Aphis glycines]
MVMTTDLKKNEFIKVKRLEYYGSLKSASAPNLVLINFRCVYSIRGSIAKAVSAAPSVSNVEKKGTRQKSFASLVFIIIFKMHTRDGMYFACVARNPSQHSIKRTIYKFILMKKKPSPKKNKKNLTFQKVYTCSYIKLQMITRVGKKFALQCWFNGYYCYYSGATILNGQAGNSTGPLNAPKPIIPPTHKTYDIIHFRAIRDFGRRRLGKAPSLSLKHHIVAMWRGVRRGAGAVRSAGRAEHLLVRWRRGGGGGKTTDRVCVCRRRRD